MILDEIAVLRHNKKYRIWKPFLEKYKCDFVAEIGIRKGIHFNYLIKHKPMLALAVDIWKDDIPAHNDVGYTQKELDKQYEDFILWSSKFSFVKTTRDYSTEAAKRYPDEYFDFVYLDGDHTYEGCLADIKAWYPKVKKGKFLVGDDYRQRTNKLGVKFGVVEAVNKFCGDNKLCFSVFPINKWLIIK